MILKALSTPPREVSGYCCMRSCKQPASCFLNNKLYCSEHYFAERRVLYLIRQAKKREGQQ